MLRAEACDLRLSSTTLDKMRVPSVMGPSKDECLARLEHLEEVLTQLKIDDNNHYCKRVLYDAVPLALGMNYENAANVLAAQLDWDTLKKHPHLLLQDASEVRVVRSVESWCFIKLNSSWVLGWVWFRKELFLFQISTQSRYELDHSLALESSSEHLLIF